MNDKPQGGERMQPTAQAPRAGRVKMRPAPKGRKKMTPDIALVVRTTL
jgi:hypothetical protein